jgi:flagellar hook-length control protein FliK
MLGDTGLGMGSFSVNVGSFAQQQQQTAFQQQNAASSSWTPANEGGLAEESLNTFVQPLRQGGRGMVDFFA